MDSNGNVSMEQLMLQMRKNNEQLPPKKLKTDRKGRLMLDPSNRHHMKWYNNDKEFGTDDGD